MDTMDAVAGKTSAQWYRQRWPWLLMLGPAIVVVAGFVTLWIAFHFDDALVADDYYKRGLAINRSLVRSARATELGLSARIELRPDGSVQAALRANAPLPPVVHLRLIHPTHAGHDTDVDLVLGPDGRYAGRLVEAAVGRRLVLIEAADWRLGPIETDGRGTSVRLEAPQP